MFSNTHCKREWTIADIHLDLSCLKGAALTTLMYFILPLCCIPLKKKWQGYMELFSRWEEIAFSMGNMEAWMEEKAWRGSLVRTKETAGSSSFSGLSRAGNSPPGLRKKERAFQGSMGDWLDSAPTLKSWACMDAMDRKGKSFISKCCSQ